MTDPEEVLPKDEEVVQIFDINKLYFGAHSIFKIATDLQEKVKYKIDIAMNSYFENYCSHENRFTKVPSYSFA